MTLTCAGRTRVRLGWTRLPREQGSLRATWPGSGQAGRCSPVRPWHSSLWSAWSPSTSGPRARAKGRRPWRSVLPRSLDPPPRRRSWRSPRPRPPLHPSRRELPRAAESSAATASAIPGRRDLRLALLRRAVSVSRPPLPTTAARPPPVETAVAHPAMRTGPREGGTSRARRRRREEAAGPRAHPTRAGGRSRRRSGKAHLKGGMGGGKLRLSRPRKGQGGASRQSKDS